MKTKFALVLLLLLALAPAVSLAQTTQGTPIPPFLLGTEAVNPNANISWPPPVYVLRGQVPIRGTASLPGMTNYFVEFRPISADLSISEGEALWFPVDLPSMAPVQNNVLETWDTTEVPDGLYELRLTVNTSAGQTQQAYVRLLRVENNPPPFAVQPTPIAVPTRPSLIPTPTLPPRLPTLAPPTPIPPTQDLTPRATINLQAANVRTGDSTFYPVIQSYRQGTAFQIIGISNRGTGWYLIQLPNGTSGWIAPSVVDISGNLGTLPLIAPPPPPATPTPTNTPVPPTPIPSGNLVAGVVALDPNQPRCAETFNVGFDVANLGSAPTTSSGIVLLQDVHGNQVTESTIGGFPMLNPGQTFRVNMPITVDTFYEEDHTLVMVIDPQNQIGETNENDNRQTLTYRLRKGNCP